MAERQLVLTRVGEEDSVELPPMGTLEGVLESFAQYNTAEDGSPRRNGMVVLHGPGMVVEIATFGETINQAMVTMKEEDYAFMVLWRLCKATAWRMTDPETGQAFG